MRKWGAIVTAFYALLLLGLLVPVGTSLLDKGGPHLSGAYGVYGLWQVWIAVGILLASEALLVFLTVDTSFKRLKPRAHILVSCVVTAMLLAVLTGAALLCLGFKSYGDAFFEKFWGGFFASFTNLALSVGAIWMAWAIIFYFYVRNSNETITRATSWLLKGSVLELLVAVPCHVIVRRRTDCSAPYVTNFGIVTGIAIMFLSFGPSVLLLYKKRLDEYGNRRPVTK
jgi:hypothetical protein